MITGAEAIVKSLENEGVSVVFGYPGAAICPFYDALTKSGNIRHILVRQEQNAGHAANGYARVTGKPGVCIATSGPGATNLITALATAYMDSIPVVAITGQVSSDLLGRDVFQEADITGAAEPFTKYSYLLKNAADLPRIIKEAFYIAGSGRPGPVLIDIPVDVQKAKLEFSYPSEVNIRGYKPSVKGNFMQIKRVCAELHKAKKPLICAGGGVISADAGKELAAFSEKYHIPVVSTMMGIGVMPPAHPLYLGMIGMHGLKAANRALSEADLLMIIGARVGDRAVATPDALENRSVIVHIDVDPAEIGKNVGTNIPLVGDAKTVFRQLLEQTVEADFSEWSSYLTEIKNIRNIDDKERTGCINPKAFIKTLCEKCEDNACVVADVGQNQIWSANYYAVQNGRFLTSGGMGTMGYSLPAAMGAKAADPDRQVIAICGDGSMQMMMMELATICQHDLPLKVIVMKNTRLGMVRELQAKLYHKNYSAVFLDKSPDFLLLAKAYGIKAKRVDNDRDVPAVIDELLSEKESMLLECVVDPEESSI